MKIYGSEIYGPTRLGRVAVGEIKKLPEIRNLRPKGSKGTNCYEERVLLFLRGNQRSREEIFNYLGVGKSGYNKSLVRLSNLGLITKIRSRKKFIKRIKKIDSEILCKPARKIDEILDQYDGDFIEEKNIYSKFKSWSSYQSGMEQLLKLDSVEKMNAKTILSLTRRGKIVANGFYRIMEEVRLVSETKLKELGSRNKNNNQNWQEQLAEAFDKVFNSD